MNDCNEQSPMSSSSPELSLTSSLNSDVDAIDLNDSIDTKEFMDISQFMQKYVTMLFDPFADIDVTCKQTFGKHCQSSEGRELFAKYVDKQRCFVKKIDETTFYKLAHSFALVLFECYDADNFGPSKTLMNMMFTFYHIPDPKACTFSVDDNTVVELNSPDGEFVDSYSHELSGDSETDNDHVPRHKDKTTNRKKFFSDNCNETTTSRSKKSIFKVANSWISKEFKIILPSHAHKKAKCTPKEEEQNESLPVHLDQDSGDCESRASTSHSSEKVERKMFLYEALRRQPIWKSLRFWNAAFFDAVNSERQRHFSQVSWKALTDEQRTCVTESIQNATFGQLGAFINNMKYLGLGRKTCMEFLRKQCIIGNLGKEHYQLLKTQLEMPLLS